VKWSRPGRAPIDEAYERTVRGDVKYRFVIDCTKL
jgi:D-arabinose 1-dehydrogenase-like Zn-dependent alcohol dehydrogenase